MELSSPNWITHLGDILNYRILKEDQNKFKTALEGIFQQISKIADIQLLSKKMHDPQKRMKYIHEAYDFYQKGVQESLLNSRFFQKMVKHAKSPSKNSTFIRDCQIPLQFDLMRLPIGRQTHHLMRWMTDLNKTILDPSSEKIQEQFYANLNNPLRQTIANQRNHLMKNIYEMVEQGEITDRHLLRTVDHFDEFIQENERQSKNKKIMQLVREYEKILLNLDPKDQKTFKAAICDDLEILANHPFIPKKKIKPLQRGPMPMVMPTSSSKSLSHSEHLEEKKSSSAPPLSIKQKIEEDLADFDRKMAVCLQDLATENTNNTNRLSGDHQHHQTDLA